MSRRSPGFRLLASPSGGGADGLSWTTLDLSAMTLVDTAGAYDSGGSTLGESSTLAFGATTHKIDSSSFAPAVWVHDAGAVTWADYMGIAFDLAFNMDGTNTGIRGLYLGVMGSASSFVRYDSRLIGWARNGTGVDRASAARIGGTINSMNLGSGTVARMRGSVIFGNSDLLAAGCGLRSSSAELDSQAVNSTGTATFAASNLYIGLASSSSTATARLYGNVVGRYSLIPLPT